MMSSIRSFLRTPSPAEHRSERQFEIAGEQLSVTIIRSRRRRRKLTLQVSLDSGVVVRAPFAAGLAEINNILLANVSWLQRRRQEIVSEQYRNPPLQYIEGEMHRYLGVEYPLLFVATAGRPKIEKRDRQLCLYGGMANAEKRLQKWYEHQAKQIMAERLAIYCEALPWLVNTPELRLRRMRSRWGSCSANGRLCLNTHLIKASLRCIDYVIVHELCHLQEFNHSPRFYALMDVAMPDWRERKVELEACGAAIIRS
jgi:predicted metal-dependent hydrolase